jgi:tyrosyl-tRNA synthetase
MLSHEGIKTRLEKGLSFLEFNYQLLQAYDFWYQFKYYNCLVQMGGSDQWGNIVAGVELIKKLENKEAYGLTFPLLTTAEGKKMGKTEKGAIWLEQKMTSVFDYYQYWINIDDKDVKKFLLIFTFLPVEQIKKLAQLKGAEIRKAKEVLAYEATKILHGEKAAEKAKEASRALFTKEKAKADLIPTIFINKKELKKGILVSKLFNMAGLTKSVSESKRLILQGGGYLNKKRITDPNFLVTESDFSGSEILLRSGKKKYCRVKIT